jgi:hypothetical protein
MKMFELIPYILELDPETEIKLIEDLEPGKDGLPKMSKVLPTMMSTPRQERRYSLSLKRVT